MHIHVSLMYHLDTPFHKISMNIQSFVVCFSAINNKKEITPYDDK